MNWDRVEIVEKDWEGRKHLYRKNYEARGKYTQNTKREQIDQETPVLMLSGSGKAKGNGSPFS